MSFNSRGISERRERGRPLLTRRSGLTRSLFVTREVISLLHSRSYKKLRMHERVAYRIPRLPNEGSCLRIADFAYFLWPPSDDLAPCSIGFIGLLFLFALGWYPC